MKGLQKTVSTLECGMNRLKKLITKPDYAEKKRKHMEAIRVCDDMIEADERIKRQEVWLQSNLDADSEKKLEVRKRLYSTREKLEELEKNYTEIMINI